MEFAILDIIFVVILLITTIRTTIKGFISEIMTLAALLLGVAAAVLFLKLGTRLIDAYFGQSNWNQVIAFLVIFLVVYIVVKIFESGLKKLFEQLNLGSLDRALGFFLGIIEGVLLIALIIIALKMQPFFDMAEAIDDSTLAGIVGYLIPYGLTFLQDKV